MTILMILLRVMKYSVSIAILSAVVCVCCLSFATAGSAQPAMGRPGIGSALSDTSPPFCTPSGCLSGGALSAQTGTASSVDWSAAILNGIVDAEGQTGTYHFEVGTTTSYGTNLPSPDASAPTSGTNVAQKITGLTPTMLYHFRVVATGSQGTVYGDDQTFITSAQPVPAVATGGASAVARTTAKLNGSVNPRDAATYHFDYGPTSNYGYRAPASEASVGPNRNTNSVAQKLSGLSQATKYHFRIVATNSAGTSYGADRTFTTGASHACSSARADRQALENRLNSTKAQLATALTRWHAARGSRRAALAKVVRTLRQRVRRLGNQLRAADTLNDDACGSSSQVSPLPPAPLAPKPPPGVPITQGHITRTQCGSGSDGYGVRFGGGSVFGVGTAPGTTVQLPAVRFLSGSGGTLQWTLSGPGTVYVDGCNAQIVEPGDSGGHSTTVYVTHLLPPSSPTPGEGGPQDVDSTYFAVNVWAPPPSLCGREYLEVSLGTAGEYFYLVTNNGAYGPYQFHTWQPIAPGSYEVDIYYLDGHRETVSATVPVCGYAKVIRS